MEKLEKLTKEQEALIPVVRDEWIDRCFSLSAREKFDEAKAREYVKFIYELAKLPEPEVLFVESPLGAQIAANYYRTLANNPAGVRDSVYYSVSDSVYNSIYASVYYSVSNSVRDSVFASVSASVSASVYASFYASVSNSVFNSVSNSVSDSIYDSVFNSVSNSVFNSVSNSVSDSVHDSVHDSGIKFEPFLNRGYWDYAWVSFYDFFTRIGVINVDAFNKYSSLLTSGIYDAICFEKLCIVCAPPSLIYRDEQNRLSSINGPAIEWKDGYKLWRINGVRFDEDLHKQVTSGEMSAKDILKIEVIDQRVVALKIRGAEKLLEELDAKKIHSSLRGNTLYCVEDAFPEFPKAYFLKYSCPSTGRVYVDGVDPGIAAASENADHCMAWKHHMSPEEYAALTQEA